MEINELVNLAIKTSANKYESQTLEIKSAKADCPKRLFDTLSSFSNQDSGGTFVFGIDEENDFEICGVYNPHDLQKRIVEQCAQMQPVCRPLFTLSEIDGKMVVSAEIPPVEFAERPCFYKGKGIVKGSYIRVGDSDMQMSSYEVYKYEAYRKQTRDDLRIIESTDISMIDNTCLENFIKSAKTRKPNLSNIDDNRVLDLLGITKNDQVTLTGWLLFGDYPQSLFPQLSLTAVVVPGTKIGDMIAGGLRFIDNRRFEGKIDEVLNSAENFILRNMKENTIIGEDLKRADKLEYPKTAIREIVLNALMHRDYSLYSDSMPISVSMFKDRIEVVNPGGLYGRTTVDDLGEIHAETRNTTLVNALEIMQIAENRHSGIPVIRKEMKESDLPPPVFEDNRGEFRVTLYNAHRDVLGFCVRPRSRKEIADFAGLTQEWAVESVINPLLNEKKLHMTLPEKPKSKLQRYIAVQGE